MEVIEVNAIIEVNVISINPIDIEKCQAYHTAITSLNSNDSELTKVQLLIVKSK
jgi:hypothetical protein